MAPDMTGDRILEGVQAIVTAIAGGDRTPARIGPDTPLGEGGFWLDSIDMLEVLIACEKKFGTSFAPGRASEALMTLRSLAEAIRTR